MIVKFTQGCKKYWNLGTSFSEIDKMENNFSLSTQYGPVVTCRNCWLVMLEEWSMEIAVLRILITLAFPYYLLTAVIYCNRTTFV